MKYEDRLRNRELTDFLDVAPGNDNKENVWLAFTFLVALLVVVGLLALAIHFV